MLWYVQLLNFPLDWISVDAADCRLESGAQCSNKVKSDHEFEENDICTCSTFGRKFRAELAIVYVCDRTLSVDARIAFDLAFDFLVSSSQANQRHSTSGS